MREVVAEGHLCLRKRHGDGAAQAGTAGARPLQYVFDRIVNNPGEGGSRQWCLCVVLSWLTFIRNADRLGALTMNRRATASYF